MLPKRKHPRLKDYDYGQDGTCFITICTYERRELFSVIDKEQDLENAVVSLTACGEIAEKQLKLLETRYPSVKIDAYVIMPDHIHFIIAVNNDNVSNKTDVNTAVCAYKSLVANECRKLLPGIKIFQTSFYDHVIRDEKDYLNCVEYIERNPGKWLFDKYYSDQ